MNKLVINRDKYRYQHVVDTQVYKINYYSFGSVQGTEGIPKCRNNAIHEVSKYSSIQNILAMSKVLKVTIKIPK